MFFRLSRFVLTSVYNAYLRVYHVRSLETINTDYMYYIDAYTFVLNDGYREAQYILVCGKSAKTYATQFIIQRLKLNLEFALFKIHYA